MSWYHIKAVWARSKAKGSARLVMLCIADHANDNNLAWPSTETIAEETQVSERQVIRAVDSLVTAGEIAIVEAGNGRGNSTVYRFLLPLKGDMVSPNGQPRKGDISSVKGDTLSLKGDISAERVTFATEKGDTMSPEVIREIPKEKSLEEKGEAPPPNPFPFKPSPVKPAVKSPADERVNALIAVCGLNRNVPDHLSAAENAAAKLSDYTADYLLKRYTYQENPNGNWYYYRDDWRGERGDMPTLKTVIETVAIQKKPASGRHPPPANRQPSEPKSFAALRQALEEE